MTEGSERKGIVFYYDWQEQIFKLPEQYQLPIIKAIFDYDRSGQKFCPDDPILEVLLDKYYTEIDKQQVNWEKRTGRPAKYELDDFIPYFTQEFKDTEIAKAIGCSTKTVQRKRQEYRTKMDKTILSKSGQKTNNNKNSCLMSLCPDKSSQETKVLSLDGQERDLGVYKKIVGEDLEPLRFEAQCRVDKGTPIDLAIFEAINALI